MNFHRPKRRREPQIVPLSLIDVVLQLVIFLLLTTTFRQADAGVEVDLPPAQTAVAGAESGITVEIDGTGSLSVAGRAVGREELGDLFRREADRHGDTRVLLRADRRARHGDVVDVMDLARSSDLRRLTIAAASRRAADLHAPSPPSF